MRICLLVGSSIGAAHEGVVDYACRLAEHLAPPVEAKVERLPGRGLRGFRRLLALVRRFDLLHVQLPCYGWRYSVLPSLVPLALLASGRRIPVVLTLHEWEFMHPLRRKLLGPLLHRAAHLVFVSHLVREQFLATPGLARLEDRCVTVPIGINVSISTPSREDVEAIRREFVGTSSTTRLLVHFGTIYEGKQPEKIIESVRLLRVAGEDVKLVFAGTCIETSDFTEVSFRALVSTSGLSDHVVFLGSVEDEALLGELLSAADAVVGLYSDGLSMRRSTFWTAAQYGCPIISTAPRSASEFADRPDVLAHPGLVLVPIDSPASAVAEALSSLPSWEFMRYPPLHATEWQAIATCHEDLYRAVLSD